MYKSINSIREEKIRTSKIMDEVHANALLTTFRSVILTKITRKELMQRIEKIKQEFPNVNEFFIFLKILRDLRLIEGIYLNNSITHESIDKVYELIFKNRYMSYLDILKHIDLDFDELTIDEILDYLIDRKEIEFNNNGYQVV
ncbi:hypothetical protein [Methanococcus maripaludis]|nr:hypothetical protein [Methanococcus maripaludis]